MSLLNEIKSSYSFKKLIELQNRYTYAGKSAEMGRAVQRFKTSQDKKDAKQISYEMNELKKFWNCHPFQYIRYDLYKKDNTLSIDELKYYVPEFFFYNIYLPYYAKKEYEIIIDDKNISDRYFKSINIKQPSTIAKIYEKVLYDEVFHEIDPRKVMEKALQYDDLFVKPTGGKGGYGIKVFSKKNGKFLSDEGDVFSEAYLRQLIKKGAWIIQPGVKQADLLAEIYPYSVNTFRIATENIGGSAKILFAMLRLGHGGARIDNTSQGAIIANIDIETGKFNGGAISRDNEIFYAHPDTGYKFSDFVNKDWEKIKDFVLSSTQKMPQFPYLGWDIALTNDGPIAIETNQGFGIDGVQPLINGLRKVIKIDDPMFYWKSKP